MTSGQARRGSRWREFQFALHQLQQAISPELGLDFVVRHWNDIAAALAEGDRERVPQLETCHTLS
jgi:hypothetical protein